MIPPIPPIAGFMDGVGGGVRSCLALRSRTHGRRAPADAWALGAGRHDRPRAGNRRLMVQGAGDEGEREGKDEHERDTSPRGNIFPGALRTVPGGGGQCSFLVRG